MILFQIFNLSKHVIYRYILLYNKHSKIKQLKLIFKLKMH